jgi:disulfide bond formation protein DsbB
LDRSILEPEQPHPEDKQMKSGLRWLFLLGFLAPAGLVGFAIYIQQVDYLMPCPLCVVQRIAYWLVGLTSLVAFLHNPSTTGRRIYAGSIGLFALGGAVVAARHAYLLRYPQSIECGISPEEKFLNALPLAKWWPTMFQAAGDCTLIKWKFLSLTIPDWSLVWFVGFVVVALYLVVAKRA